MKRIVAVSVGRSDYGIFKPVFRAIESRPDLELKIVAAGMHLSPEFGLTVAAFDRDGFQVDERVEMLLSADTPGGISRSMGMGTIGFAHAYEKTAPDILLLLGDRFEMHAAAVASVPFAIPIAHIHGGEVTEGAIDDLFRHSITKMSHLHFVSAAPHAARVLQMGEEPWRVHVTGAPSLDNIGQIRQLDRAELEAQLQLSLEPRPLLVTFHPVTLEFEHTRTYVDTLLEALAAAALPVIFTLPNADTGGRVISEQITAYCRTHSEAVVVDNLGTEAYFSLMRHAAAMVGNSSSGLLEAPSFELPVVNIGSRQGGRVRAANVIDVGNTRHEILDGIRRATSTEFRASLRGLTNPYGSGHAGEAIAEHLALAPDRQALMRKRFIDIAQVRTA